MKKKLIIVFDGPPASGKTTFSKILASRFCCPVVQYKALGLANFASALILRLSPSHSKIDNTCYYKKRDSILNINEQILNKMHFIIFLSEILYKILQIEKLILSCLFYNCLIVDEFLVLRSANYINVYLNNGLKKWQALLLIRLDITLLKILSYIGNLRYIYINRHIDEIKRFWYKRSHSEDYPSDKFLKLIQLIWSNSKELIYQIANKNVYMHSP